MVLSFIIIRFELPLKKNCVLFTYQSIFLVFNSALTTYNSNNTIKQSNKSVVSEESISLSKYNLT